MNDLLDKWTGKGALPAQTSLLALAVAPAVGIVYHPGTHEPFY